MMNFFKTDIRQYDEVSSNYKMFIELMDFF